MFEKIIRTDAVEYHLPPEGVNALMKYKGKRGFFRAFAIRDLEFNQPGVIHLSRKESGEMLQNWFEETMGELGFSVQRSKTV